MSSVTRNEYTNEERNLIACYIIKHKYYSKLRGNAIWKEMEQKHVLNTRSWQSMKNHFQKKMIHNLHYLNISVEERNKLQTGYNASRRKIEIPSEGKHVYLRVKKKFLNFSDEEHSSNENMQTAKEASSGSSQGNESLQRINKEVGPSSPLQLSTKTPLASQNSTYFSSSEESLDVFQGLSLKANKSVQISTEDQDDFIDAPAPNYLIFAVNSEEHIFLPLSKIHLKEMLENQFNINPSHIHLANEKQFLELLQIKQIQNKVNKEFRKVLTDYLDHGVPFSENCDRDTIIETTNLIRQKFFPDDSGNIDDENEKSASADERRKVSADRSERCANMDEAVETNMNHHINEVERAQNKTESNVDMLERPALN